MLPEIKRNKRCAGALASGKLIVRPFENKKQRKHNGRCERMVVVVKGVKMCRGGALGIIWTSPVVCMIDDEIHCENNSYWVLKGELV